MQENVNRGGWIRSLGLLVGSGLSLMAAQVPTWALPLIPRPDIKVLRSAQVLRVVNYNTLVVQVDGEASTKLVSLIGIAPLPPINMGWEQLTGETPLAEYNAGQFLQEMVNRKTVYLELDPNLDRSAPVMPAYVWNGETLVNQEMLFQGHAELTDKLGGLKYGNQLGEAHQTAVKQGRGFWNFYGPKPPTVPLA